MKSNFLGLWLLTVILSIQDALAVKKFMFKECHQSPFCDRNRHYAAQVSQARDSETGWKSPYSLDLYSIEFSKSSKESIGTLSGVIHKYVAGKVVDLILEITLLIDSGIRISIDEKARRNGDVDFGDNSGIRKERYDVSPLAFEESAQFADKFEYKTSENGITVPFGDGNELLIQPDPVQFIFSRKGEQQVIINGKHFLNYEHWRKKVEKQGDEPLPSDMLEQSSLESQNGLWEDRFDNHWDFKKRGPESVAVDVTFNGYNHVYGIPEHADKLSLRGTKGGEDNHNDPYRLWNVDIFEYETNSFMPMYGAIPFMQANKPGSSAGFFWGNAADTFIDIDKAVGETTTHWISENGKIDFVVFLGDTPRDISKQYGKLTGYTTLPNQNSLGYHQCRWNYNSQDDVLDVHSKFDEHQIPYDYIWLDIEYTDAKKYFTWNEDVFPDHVAMMHELEKSKRGLVTIIDPHIKKESGYSTYDTIAEPGLSVCNANNDVFYGHCWPGESVWIEPFNSEIQDYFDEWYSKEGYLGGDAPNMQLWNDMNEPSVFSGPETSMPRDNIHYGQWEHRDLHNIYGMTFHNATYNSLVKRYDGETRPFILTRSFYAGSQRTAAMWTGDNMAKWEYLNIATPMILTQQIAGMPFAGADVGGFFGNPDAELLARWYQAGTFYPFFRAHAHIDTRRREPYLIEEPFQQAIVDAIKLRYKLLPVFYTAFYEASVSGQPVLVPTYYEAPDNEVAYGIDDQFYVGNSGLLVKPVTHKDTSMVKIFVPDDEIYYDYNSGLQTGSGSVWVEYEAMLDTIPILMKGGHIHARKDRNRRSTELMKFDPYTLVIAVDQYKTAQGSLYVDDGKSFAYRDGDYLYQNFSFDKNTLKAEPEHLPTKTVHFTEVPVGKIELMGVKPTNIGDTVTITENGKTWTAEVIKQDHHIVIRNPRMSIGGSWELKF